MILDEKGGGRRKEKGEVRGTDRLTKTGVCRGVRERECVRQIRER